MATGADSVGFGLVASLSHPGGNVTGLANFAEMLASKQIDLLREMLPGLARFGFLVNVTNHLHMPQLRETKTAAQAAGILLVPVEVSSPDELDSAFATLGAESVEALLVPPDTTFYSRRQQISALAATARLPAIYGRRLDFAECPINDATLKSASPGTAALPPIADIGASFVSTAVRDGIADTAKRRRVAVDVP
jgi:putative tryptophan/tyrosine transport system substrate-binding protein